MQKSAVQRRAATFETRDHLIAVRPQSHFARPPFSDPLTDDDPHVTGPLYGHKKEHNVSLKSRGSVETWQF